MSDTAMTIFSIGYIAGVAVGQILAARDRGKEEGTAMIEEPEEILTWALCESSGGGGKGICDLSRCVCLDEARDVLRILNEKGYIICHASLVDVSAVGAAIAKAEGRK
jgi:hypothetical protein